MPDNLHHSLELIRCSLLALKPSGKDGFEGALSLALTRLTGIPFRLAASGFQGGMDGDGALPTDAVCFESKRYSESPKRETVLTKIADLARSRPDADRLWVLGVTAEANAQLSSEVLGKIHHRMFGGHVSARRAAAASRAAIASWQARVS